MRFTDYERAYVAEHYLNESCEVIAKALNRPRHSIYNEANRQGLKKSETYIAEMLAKNGDKLKEIGANTRFKKGAEVWNKGLKGLPSVGRQVETQFKPGGLPGNTLYDGCVRLRADGYLYIRLDKAKWDLWHRVLWREHYGEIPAKALIVFKDGNPQNCVIENLECIDYTQNMKKNSIHNYPEEIIATIQQINGLNRRIKNIKKKDAK